MLGNVTHNIQVHYASVLISGVTRKKANRKGGCATCLQTSTRASFSVLCWTDVESGRDEAMVRVLETLQRLELKVDKISNMSGSRVMDPSQSSGTLSFQQTPRLGSVGERFRGETHSRQRSYSRLTVTHKIILWPRVYSTLINSNPQAVPLLQAMSDGGTPWLIRHHTSEHEQGLPFGVGLPCFPSNASLN